MLFKSAGHSKSDIDGLHNFPRIVAETENQYDRALNLHDLIECCKEAESDQRQNRRDEDFQRFFMELPVPCQINVPLIPSSTYNLNVQRSRMIAIDTKEQTISLW